MATNFGPEATNVSNIPSAQTPKEGITRQPIFLQGLTDVFGQAAELVSANKKSKQQNAVAAFTQRQLLVADALAQGTIRSSAHAQSLFRKNLLDSIEANPALLGDFLEAQGKITGIPGAADNIKDGTIEEQRRKALIDESVANGTLPFNASDEEADAQIEEDRALKVAAQEHDRQIKILDEQSKRLDLSDKQRRDIEEKRKLADRDFALKAAPTEFKRVTNKLQEILDSDLTESEKLVAVGDFKADFRSQATELISSLGAQEASVLLAPFDLVFDNFSKRVTGEITDDEVKRSNERIIAVATHEALKDPIIRNLIVTSKAVGTELFGKILLESSDKVSSAFVKFIAGTTPGQTIPPPVFTSDPIEEKGIKLGLSVILDGINSDDPELVKESEERLKLVLSSIEDYQGLLKRDPKAGKEFVKWVSSSDFIKLRKSRPDLFEDVSVVTDIVSRFYSDKVWGAVRKEFRENGISRQSVNPESGPFTPLVPKVLNTKTPTPESVGTRPIDGGMEFFALDPNDKAAVDKARTLNRDLKPIINTTVKALSHLEGNENHKQTWETVSVDFLGGSIDGVTQGGDSATSNGTTTPEGQPSTTDLNLDDLKEFQSKFEGALPKFADAIAGVESKGSGDYNAVGPVMKSGSFKGDKAYGRYQVMGGNIPAWTQLALGESLSVEEFMNGTDDMTAQEIQDEVFATVFGNLLKRFGNADDAASAWFSGRPLKNAQNASDGFIKAPEFVRRFRKGLE